MMETIKLGKTSQIWFKGYIRWFFTRIQVYRNSVKERLFRVDMSTDVTNRVTWPVYFLVKAVRFGTEEEIECSFQVKIKTNRVIPISKETLANISQCFENYSSWASHLSMDTPANSRCQNDMDKLPWKAAPESVNLPGMTRPFGNCALNLC